MELRFADTGGCCDGNNLAAAGLPNIDTLGVQGGYIHTDQEFMLIDSLTQRAKLSLLLLDRLSRQGDELLALREQQSRAEEGLATC
jgi:glutamate carboxypeptidase